jgi:hypothetical protein
MRWSDEVRAKIERAASGQRNGEIRRNGSRRKGVDNGRRNRIAEE